MIAADNCFVPDRVLIEVLAVDGRCAQQKPRPPNTMQR